MADNTKVKVNYDYCEFDGSAIGKLLTHDTLSVKAENQGHEFTLCVPYHAIEMATIERNITRTVQSDVNCEADSDCEFTLLYALNPMSPPSPIENERLSIPVGASARIFVYNGDPSDYDINNLIGITSINSSNSEIATVALNEVPNQATTAVVTNQISSGTENAIITVSAGGCTLTFTAICEGMA